ncbi:MAG TPA: sensor histidine kinase [Ensifer sp.]|jgi:signal transduction histidine kinase|uniref:sensor histidine kinase n=1 Tax=Ensifer sp. TaxID=1872086 RepID=UPI002E132A94|nr:sensor histidine kinase [Ensifer sp.]
MSREIAYDAVAEPSAPPPRIRFGVALAFLAMGVTTCLFAGLLLLTRAQSDGAAIERQAARRAVALTLAFDQEVIAAKSLLTGLSRSPAVISRDLRGIYEQFMTTAVPDGAWLLFQDMEKQLVNSARLFGTELPRHTVFSDYEKLFGPIRERGSSVTGRIVGAATGTVLVAISLGTDGVRGAVTHFVTTLLSERHLRTILNKEAFPNGWERGLYDNEFRPIVTGGDDDTPAPSSLAARLRGIPLDDVMNGIYQETSGGDPMLVAYSRSNVTEWTTVIRVPLAAINAPVNAALWEIAGLAGFLLLASALAVSFTARRMERPLQALSDRLTSSTRQVDELSGQLLALQEEERQRIARELHDSTAQHVVAARIGLAGLTENVRANAGDRMALTQVEDLLCKALKELRIFTYLLHPPDLARDGLQTTLRLYIEGFAGRTGLASRIRIPEEVDRICPEIQWSILRVVQEALANVHRHADASHVSIHARISARRLVVRIRDDGCGIAGATASDAPIRFGVGIPGMRARLKQFGGDLRIRTGRCGTAIVANIPLSTAILRTTRADGGMAALLPSSASSRRMAVP